MSERVIKRIDSLNGKHYLEVIERGDGLFLFEGYSETVEDGKTFWTPSACSGLFDSAEVAEREARADVPWLKAEISN